MDRLPMKKSTFEVDEIFCGMSGETWHGGESNNGNYKTAKTIIILRADSRFRKFDLSTFQGRSRALMIEIEGTSERLALAKMFEMMSKALTSEDPQSSYFASAFPTHEEIENLY